MPDCLPITIHAPSGVAVEASVWVNPEGTAAARLYDAEKIEVAWETVEEEQVLTEQNTISHEVSVSAGDSETVYAQPGTYWVSATVDGVEMAGGQGSLLRIQLEGGAHTVRVDKPVLAPSEIYAALVALGLIVEEE